MAVHYMKGPRGGLFSGEMTAEQVSEWVDAGATELTQAEYEAEQDAQQAIRESQLDPAPTPEP